MSNRQNKRIPNWGIALIALALLAFGFYWAFAKSLPFQGDGYTVKGVFQDAQSIRVDSPVRVAGVDVGKVTKVEHLLDEDGNGQDAAVVTMSIKDDARPINSDATMRLRPRLFLEGNLFVDLQPGTPQGEELESGGMIPLEQTSASVQLDQVLTSLQAPVRGQLSTFLQEFGTALCGTADPDEECTPNSGSAGFQELFKTSPAAFRSTAQVNEALLGKEPGDLVGVVRNLGNTVEALDRNREELKDLVTNFRTVTGSFAAESEALEEGIAELPGVLSVGRPALAKLNDDLPVLRAFAREALPGVRSANVNLDDANPFLRQLRALVSKPELRGLVKDLRPTIPELAQLAKSTIPFFEETRALSSCFNNTILPWSNLDVPEAANDPSPAGQVYKETGYALSGVAGETRGGDANGQPLRVLGGGGTLTVSLPSVEVSPGDTQNLAGLIPFELIGAQPAKQTSAKTPFNPFAPCENQDLPVLETGSPPNPPESAGTPLEEAMPAEMQEISDRFGKLFFDMQMADQMQASGDRAGAAELRQGLAQEIKAFLKNDYPEYREMVEDLTGEELKGVKG